MKTFEEFYPYYLKEHSNPYNRIMHVIGTTGVLYCVIMALFRLDPKYLGYAPLFGYGFAWIGHFFIERNKPATFKYPTWSLKGDFRMYRELLTGQLSLYSHWRKANK